MSEIIRSLESSTRYRESLGSGLWVMNDHRWSFYAWERECAARPHLLVHIDHHWDAVNDWNTSEKIATIKQATIGEIEEWTSDWPGRIRYDNFIAPAIIRGLVDEVWFLCEQSYGDRAFWTPFLEEYAGRQTLFASVHELRSALSGIDRPLIVDIDLDLFNRHSQYYGASLEVVTALAATIQVAKVVTIATSRDDGWRNGDEVAEWAWDAELAAQVAAEVVPAVVRLRTSR